MSKERVSLSDIFVTIEENNHFLWDIASKADATLIIKDYVNHIATLNESSHKEYSDWMRERVDDEGKKKTRWNILEWWIAAAIQYNNLCLTRIKNVAEGKSTNRFNHETALDKLINNTTQRKKGWKASMVEAWFDYCVQHTLDPHIFQQAKDYGVDYDN